MYLEALNNGLIVPDPDVDLLSINNLPSVVYVTCYTDITDNFSYELCQSATDTFVDPIDDKKPTEAKIIIDPPIVVEPNEAQTITDLPIEAQNNSDLPIVVEPIEAKNIISYLPVEEENESQIWLINYGKELQGRVISDREIESHYYDIHTALVNTFYSACRSLKMPPFLFFFLFFFGVESWAAAHGLYRCAVY